MAQKGGKSSILAPLFPYNATVATVEKEFHHGSIQETSAGWVSLSNAVGSYIVLWIDTAYSRTFSAHVHRYACTDAGLRGRRPSGHHNESNGYTRTNADSRSLYGPHSPPMNSVMECGVLALISHQVFTAPKPAMVALGEGYQALAAVPARL